MQNYLTEQKKRDILLVASAMINIITVYHPLNREATLRHFQFDEYTIPDNGRFQYIILGRDITSLIAEDRISLQLSRTDAQTSLLSREIERLPRYQFAFGRDYTFELATLK